MSDKPNTYPRQFSVECCGKHIGVVVQEGKGSYWWYLWDDTLDWHNKERARDHKRTARSRRTAEKEMFDTYLYEAASQRAANIVEGVKRRLQGKHEAAECAAFERGRAEGASLVLSDMSLNDMLGNPTDEDKRHDPMEVATWLAKTIDGSSYMPADILPLDKRNNDAKYGDRSLMSRVCEAITDAGGGLIVEAYCRDDLVRALSENFGTKIKEENDYFRESVLEEIQILAAKVAFGQGEHLLDDLATLRHKLASWGVTGATGAQAELVLPFRYGQFP